MSTCTKVSTVWPADSQLAFSSSCTGARMLCLFVSTMQPFISISSTMKCACAHPPTLLCTVPPGPGCRCAFATRAAVAKTGRNPSCYIWQAPSTCVHALWDSTAKLLRLGVGGLVGSVRSGWKLGQPAQTRAWTTLDAGPWRAARPGWPTISRLNIRSSSQTLLKYRSSVSTRQWMNSKVASSFCSGRKVSNLANLAA